MDTRKAFIFAPRLTVLSCSDIKTQQTREPPMISKTLSSLFLFGALAAVALVPVLSLADDTPSVRPVVIVPGQLEASLSLDLDGDGRADSVEILSLNQEFNRLRVRTASGKELTFDGLVRTTWEKLYPNNAGG